MFTIEGIKPDIIFKNKKNPTSGIVETSAHMRQTLAKEGKPVVVAFSRGKDSIAAMIALMADGVEVIPVHLYRVPGLKFEEDSLKYFEDFFQMKIWNLPHRDLYYYLTEGVSMAPWQNSICEAANIPAPPHEFIWAVFKDNLGLDPDTWVCDGIRAADSPARRVSIQRHTPWTSKTIKWKGHEVPKRLAHVVHDWKIADIRQCLAMNKVELPVDYEMFGRTFDGLDYRFIKPLSEHLPEDYQQCLEWFPAIEMEMMRYEFI